MRCTGRSVACLLLLSALGRIQLISAQDAQGVDQIVDATNQVKQGLLSKIGLGTVAVVPATIAPTSTIPVTPITVATPPTSASPATTAAVTTATTPTTTAAPITTAAVTTAATPTTTAAPSTIAAASTKPATTSTAAPTTTIAAPTTTATPLTTAAGTTTKPATTPPPSTACPTGSVLVNMVCVLTCTAGSTPANPCANNAYPTNSNQIDYTNATPGDVTCEPGTDGNNYVTYTHSTKVKCTTNADCISGNAAGGAVCSTNNSTYCHQGASPSICPASGRKLLQHAY